MPEPNHVNAVVAFLRAQPTITARTTASRVFGTDGVPKSHNPSMPRDAIVVSPAGGLGAIGSAYQDYSDKRVDVACYGATQDGSHTLFLLVRKALKQLDHEAVLDSASQKVLIHWARVSADGATGKDPEHEWPMTLSSWQVLVSEVGIPA